jgi:hypothetical protein
MSHVEMFVDKDVAFALFGVCFLSIFPQVNAFLLIPQ